MMQVGLAFGTLLGRFWVDFGSKLGGKLGPSWHQNAKNEGPKTMSKKGMRTWTPAHASRGGGAPYNQSIKPSKDQTMGIRTLPSGTRPGGGFYFWTPEYDFHIHKIRFASTRNSGSLLLDLLLHIFFLNSAFRTFGRNLERPTRISNVRRGFRTFNPNFERSTRISNVRPESRTSGRDLEKSDVAKNGLRNIRRI